MVNTIDVAFGAAILTLVVYWFRHNGVKLFKVQAHCNFNVFYATESGTAEQFAYRIGKSIAPLTSGETTVENLRNFSDVSCSKNLCSYLAKLSRQVSHVGFLLLEIQC